MNAVTQAPADHRRMARTLISEMERADGLAPLDVDRFWADQEVAVADPFGPNIPQLPFGAQTTNECVYAELGIEEDFWRYAHDDTWRLSLNRAYNDKAERIVGRRLLSEAPHDPSAVYPETRKLHDVFEARNVWLDQSWWLEQSVDSADDLRRLLDRVDARNVRSFILPDNWAEEKARLMARGIKPPLYRGQRGPCTFATSIFGTENFLLLVFDDPDLAVRLRDTILRVMLEIAHVFDDEAGYTPATAPHGFSFYDDNCALLSPAMYGLFGAPILKAVFERYAPDWGDRRYQHSDSAMGHLLPQLGALGLNRVNFGPTVMADQIREHLPHAVIDGVLAPFTYSRNEHENIVLELLRDFEMSRLERGLVFATAGSVNNGSSLQSMRLIMAAIQRYCRYDH